MDPLAIEQLRKRERDDIQMIKRDEGLFHFDEDQFVADFTVEELQLHERIGKGTFAVTRAIYKPLNLPMAVKIIKIIDRTQWRAKWREDEDYANIEIDNWRRTRHENVIWEYGFAIEYDRCYMCMELMYTNLDEVKKVAYDKEGLNVGRRLEAAEWEQFLGCVTVAVVDGLAFLKENGRAVNHEIAPPHIMFNDRGQVKIGEGVSRWPIIPDHYAYNRGLNHFMAPEQFSRNSADKGDGTETNVWRLGISLIVCTTGKTPFEADTEFETFTQIVDGTPPRMDRNSGFSDDLCDFVNACLCKSVFERCSLDATDENSVQPDISIMNDKLHEKRGKAERRNNVSEVIKLVTPHLSTLRKDLN